MMIKMRMIPIERKSLYTGLTSFIEEQVVYCTCWDSGCVFTGALYLSNTFYFASASTNN
jgi:hypothetical protein